MLELIINNVGSAAAMAGSLTPGRPLLRRYDRAMPDADSKRASPFDARAYWEERLGEDCSLRTVGLRRLGARFNEWAYRVRRDVFLDLGRSVVPDLPRVRVLDVGSGTGFYLDRWRELGAASITALDLTEAAAARLREQYPAIPVVRADISGDIGAIPELSAESFDVVSAMDVLFHIVDDDAFRQALVNIRSLLVPGGLFVWSDIFSHFADSRVDHRASRTLAAIERLLDGAGFEVVQRRPMFVLMNDPVDTRSAVPVWLWKAGFGLCSLAEPLGAFAGWALYPLESRLVRTRTESPTTEIMVCRAR